MAHIQIPLPALQITFAATLDRFRNIYMREALSNTIKDVDLSELNKELTEFVPKKYLSDLATLGLRGELLFPTPCLLRQNPYLIGYYRLLLGFSQKEFYTTQFGVSRFKSMETKGLLTAKNSSDIPKLCKALVSSICGLFDGIGINKINHEKLDDLTLLTLGPQLRGGANVKKGSAAIITVFEAIHEIVKHAVTDSTANKIEIVNAADRNVSIEFAPDPDIVIREEMSAQSTRNIIAIEVKGGTDFSNIHNRIGEAEKSHQKAKAAGYVERWTVVNVDRIDLKMAKKESPSTHRFYRISALTSGNGKEYDDFKNRIISLTSIKTGQP